MSISTFILQSARHYWRAHLGLLLGVFLASAILTGSLLVGDSVRASLRRVAESRLGKVQTGILGGDRWFTESLARTSGSAPVILAMGSVSAASGGTRVNGAQVLGVDDAFWKLSPSGNGPVLKKGEVAVNESLARRLQLKTGDTLVVRLERPSAISRDAPLSGNTNDNITLRRTVSAVVTSEQFGAFQLIAAPTSPDSLWIDLADLQVQLEMDGKVNALLSAQAAFSTQAAEMEQRKTLDDFGLKLGRLAGARKEWEISTDRVFLDDRLVHQVREAEKESYGVLTYLINGIQSAKGKTPYSMITAVETGAGGPIPQLSASGKSGEAQANQEGMVISQWLAEDQQLAVGDSLDIRYFIVGTGRELKEQTTTFRVEGILPMTDPEVNRQWTPQFPGVSDVDNCRDWDPGMPMDTKAIRDKDEKYWDDYKGTPKGFIRLAAGQKIWGNRFGQLTALRFPDRGQEEAALRTQLLASLKLSDIGLVARAFKTDADAAAKGSVDFGGLFIGLSLFLIAAALIFAALLFLFTLERRAGQVGLLLAMGWHPKQVRRSLLGEAGVVAIVGALLGVFGGELYTRMALAGLRGAWADAAQGLPLIYDGAVGTKVGAAVGAVLVVLLTLWWASRKLFNVPARDLLSGAEGYETALSIRGQKPSLLKRLSLPLCLILAVVLVAGSTQVQAPEAVAGMFFGSGLLLMVAGLLFAGRWMRRETQIDVANSSETTPQSVMQLGLRNVARRPSRSLAVIGMMAGGIFLVTAVNAFRMNAGDTTLPTSGTGGYTLVGESSLPVYENLDTKSGWEAFGLDEELLKAVRLVPFRVLPGDDASCLNLNRAQRSVLVGVDAAKLQGRFRFAAGSSWDELKAGEPIPAIADQATAMWGLGKGIGDTMEYQDAAGNTFLVKLVGLLAGSVLQGKMIISEQAFLSRYPDTAGYRFFLVEAPTQQAEEIAAHLTRQLEQRGLALEPASTRLEAFLSVQNTYIGIFTLLGGLGVLLGTAGLGVLVARHVLERRGELGLMQALGFLPAALRRMVLGEHVVLLALGVLLGAVTALLSVWPALVRGGGDLPLGLMVALLSGILCFGVLICAVAVRLAVRGRLLDALRRE